MLPGLLAFFLVAFGVPLYEASQGNWLGRGLGEPDWEKIRTGETASRITAEYAAQSRLADEVRPLYNEMLYLGFERTVDSVVPGIITEEGTRWFFASASLYRFQDPEAPRLVARFAELVDRLSRNLEARGTRLLLMPLPVKPTVHPEKLRHPVARAEVWRPMVEALKARGVWVHDVAPSFDLERHGDVFNPNNTHWTNETAYRTALATAEIIGEAYGEDLPGVPVKGRFRRSEPRAVTGDLGRSLGFRPGSRAEELIKYPYTFIDGVGEDGMRLSGFEPGQDLVLVGSSFCFSYQFGPMLSAALGRQVEDLSDRGLGGVGALSRLFENIGAEGRNLPKLIVWEFPEKYLLFETDQLLSYLSELNLTLGDPTYLGWDATPLPFKVKKANELPYEIGGDGTVITGKPLGYDPYLILELEEPIPVDGTWALAYRVQAEKKTRTKILFDFGKGLVRLEDCIQPVSGRNKTTQVVIRVPEGSGAAVHGFRIDPVDTKSPFVLRDIAVLRRPAEKD
jgi:SGNH hydrolase-like domain, acetyltransferase AlgX